MIIGLKTKACTPESKRGVRRFNLRIYMVYYKCSLAKKDRAKGTFIVTLTDMRLIWKSLLVFYLENFPPYTEVSTFI